jgi:hypothetical protein
MQPAKAAQEVPTIYRFTVVYEDLELRFLDPERIELAEGDVLILDFQGIPKDMIPGVTFSSGDDPASLLGPFQDALQIADAVVLRGNSGLADQFRCTALLSPKVRGEDPPISSSNELPIGNGLGPLPAKEIRVLIRPEAVSSEVPVKVTVYPEEVTLYAPDPVVWSFVFENLEPRDYEPLLYFAPTPRAPAGTGPFGPFQSLSTAGLFEPLGEGGNLGYRLITSGNNNVQGKYHFNVGVRPVGGESNGIFSVVDPIIDNIGPPHV